MTAPPPKEQTRVMIVDDEPRLRQLLTEMTRRVGFAAEAAASAEESLRKLAANPCPIALIDLNLPGMDGMALFQRLRQEHPGMQVVVLTGFGDLESAKRAIHLDVVDFLTKPCHLGELEGALCRAWQRLSPQAPPAPAESSGPLREVEKQHILAAIDRHAGNRKAAAEELGISLRTLYYRLSEYGEGD